MSLAMRLKSAPESTPKGLPPLEKDDAKILAVFVFALVAICVSNLAALIFPAVLP